MPWSKLDMADQIVELLLPGCSINLGIGMPTLVAERIPEQMGIQIHSENGLLGIGGRPSKETVSPTLINAGKETVTLRKGGSFFDSAMSFGMIRGGHIDCCVLGVMEVDVEGSLANWMIPGKKVAGMGGAMDLVHGSSNTIAMLNHFTKQGDSKLVKKCSLPLTGQRVIDTIVSSAGIFKPTGTKFKIVKLAPGVAKDSLGVPLELIEA